MAVDEAGLVHGGFLFGLADYAAMLAVNDPFVVLAAAEVRLLLPVAVGESVTAEARVVESAGRKNRVEARLTLGEEVVMSGTFTCVTLDRHVLEGRR
jgi:acyl-coenzyme A thioesterase PaaI-like protein